MAVYSERTLCWQTRSLLAWCILSTVLLIVLLPLYSIAESYGYDSASSCDPSQTSRRGRSQLLETIPCDLTTQAYCNLPGSAYPWHAVRRFVHENQGLMRRMYGDMRHISVLKEEFEENEIELDDIDRATERYSRQQFEPDRGRRLDGGKRMKYLRPSLPQHYDGLGHYQRDKSNEIVLNEPHFRPAQLKTTSTTTTMATTMVRSAISSSEVSKSTAIPKPTPETFTTPTTASVESTVQSIRSTEAPKTESVKSTTTDTSIHKSEADNKPIATVIENIKLDTNNDLESDRSNSPVENGKINPMGNETIHMTPLNTLSKLETSESIVTSAGPEATEMGNDAKISSTLKLTSSSTQAAAEEQHQDSHFSTSSSAVVDKIESTISRYPLNDRQDNNTANVESDRQAELDQKEKANTAAEALIHHDSVQASSMIQQQKIRFESIKVGASGGGTSTPAKKANGDGQLFQDAAQKEPPVVNGRGVNACPVKEEVVAPFWANNTRGEVLALLNLYPFEQYVHWEKCTHELKQMYCREGCRCEQQYRLHRLLAYDPHNECRGIFSDWFRFPSCCICKCYDMPFDFRVTSRSPRSLTKESFELVEDELQNAIYEHATHEWYRPKEYDYE